MAKNEFVPQVNDVNRISAGTEIKGTLNSSGDIRIDGAFDGKLSTGGKLVIGESAKFKGEIICKSCDVWGHLEGNIVVKELLGLKRAGYIKGDVLCQKLIIEEGGNFNGTCKMITDSEFEKKKIDTKAEIVDPPKVEKEKEK